MLAGMTYYQILWYFLIYSIIGWMVEVVFHAVVLGKIINRGFLNGPVCPVYGFGMLAVLAVINTISSSTALTVSASNPWLVFLASMVLASAVEFLAGWLLLHLFHARWWDYSDKPFNLGGYICAEFSILWGLGGILVVKVFHPMVQNASAGSIPEKIGWPILLLSYLLYLSDAVVTVLIVIGLNKQLEELNTIRSNMRVVSNAMSNRIGQTTIVTSRFVEESQVQAALARAELKHKVSDWKETALDSATSMKASTVRRASGVKKAAVSGAGSVKAAAVSTAGTLKETASSAAGTLKEYAAKTTAIQKKLLRPVVFGPARLLRAFPQLQHLHYAEDLRALQDKLKENRDGT